MPGAARFSQCANHNWRNLMCASIIMVSLQRHTSPNLSLSRFVASQQRRQM
jgi:hypothetical protein